MQFEPEKFYYDVSLDGKTLATARYADNKYQTILLDAITRKELSKVDGLIRFVQSPDNPIAWKPMEALYTQIDEVNSLFNKRCENAPYFPYPVEIEEDKFAIQRDSFVEVVNLSTCKVENSIHYYSAGNNSSISPNGQFIATSGKDGILVWNGLTGKISMELIGGSFTAIDDVFSFDQTGNLLLTGKRGYKNAYSGQFRRYHISIWDVSTGKKIREITPVTEYLNQIIPTADKNVVMIEDGAGFNFWDIQTDKLLITLPYGKFVFSPDGNSIWISVVKQEANRAKGIKDNQVLTQYNYHTGEILQQLGPSDSPTQGLYLNNDGTKMALHLWVERAGKTDEDVLKLVDLASDEVLWEFRWDITTEPFVRTSKTDDDEKYGFGKKFYLRQDGNTLAKYGFPLYTDLWSFQSEKPYSVIPHGQMLGNSNIVITTNTQLPYSYDKEVTQFWSSKTGNLLGEITTRYKINAISFSPLGNLIAASGDYGIIHLWGVKRIDR
jgi:WD40 repeat protein